MACRRGSCAGIPLCNANIQCVGFEQGAGDGCTGLANGSSRLQFNALGELEICSNVGGVCTCESTVAGTDTLVDNLDGTLTHTAIDGAIVTFCNGIDNILHEDTCPEGGIGADYMIREATLVTAAGCTELRLEGAPEHTSICSTVDAADFVVHGSPGVGTITNVLPSNLVVNNISPCRDMACMINYTGGMLFMSHDNDGGTPEKIGPDQVELNPVFTVNGGAVFNPAARNAGGAVEIYGLDFRVDYATQGWSGCHTLAPGAALTIASSYELNVIGNTSIVNLISQGGSITVLASTI